MTQSYVIFFLSEEYSKPCQISKMELFVKYFIKRSILDVW